MITINGNDFELALVDTNIVSEILKNSSGEFRTFLDLTCARNCIPSFSVFTVLELRQRRDIYDRFLEAFSFFPCILLKSHEVLFLEELNRFPNASVIDPTALVSRGVVAAPDRKLRELLKAMFAMPEFLEMERSWNGDKARIVSGILKLRSSFPPQRDEYTKKEIREFVELAGLEQIPSDFIRNAIDSGFPLSIDAFPSLKMMLFTVFHKFYVDNRIPSLSDAFDIAISAPTPYVDAVFTENHQAEVIRKIKRQDRFLEHVSVYSLRDLRRTQKAD